VGSQTAGDRLFPTEKPPNLTNLLDGHPLGAGDETRTRDILLGRQKLYQLSYSRAELL
jgi:hypothetical protein